MDGEQNSDGYRFTERIGDRLIGTDYFVARENLDFYRRLASKADLFGKLFSYSEVHDGDLEKLVEHHGSAPVWAFFDHYSRHDFLVTPLRAFREYGVLMRIIAGADVMAGKHRDIMTNGLAVPVPRTSEHRTKGNLADLETNLMLLAEHQKTVLAFRWKGRDYGQEQPMGEEFGLIMGILGSFNKLRAEYGSAVSEAFIYSGSIAYSRIVEDERFLSARTNQIKGNVEMTESTDEEMMIKDLLLQKKQMYIHLSDAFEVTDFVKANGLLKDDGAINARNAGKFLKDRIVAEARKLRHPVPIQIVCEAARRALRRKWIELTDELLSDRQLSFVLDESTLYSNISEVRDDLISRKELQYRDFFERDGLPIPPHEIMHEAMPYLFQDRPTIAGSLLASAAYIYRALTRPEKTRSRAKHLDTIIRYANQSEPLRDIMFETRRNQRPVVEIHNPGVVLYYSRLLGRMMV